MVKNKMVYTSFDGNNMIHIDNMREFAIKNSYIPINPEHALGYYISTRAHKNLKSEVLKDCLSLVKISDEFWVFTNSKTENVPFSSFPEGVIIEILLWIKVGGSSIKIFSIPRITEVFRKNEQYTGECRDIKISNIEEMANSDYFSEISKYLEDDVSNLPLAMDVHLKRVLRRSGLFDINTARGISEMMTSFKIEQPKFPAILGTPLWYIGRNYCHKKSPECLFCPQIDNCLKKGVN